MPNTREIVRIACKLLSLLFLVWGISTVPLIAQGIVSLFVEDQRPLIMPFGYTFVPFLYLASSAIFWKFSEQITERIISSEQDDYISPDQSWQKGFYEVCIRLIGIYVVVSAVPQVINPLINIIAVSRSQQTVPVHVWSSIIGAVIYLALGIHLLAGGRLFNRLAENLSSRTSSTNS